MLEPCALSPVIITQPIHWPGVPWPVEFPLEELGGTLKKCTYERVSKSDRGQLTCDGHTEVCAKQTEDIWPCENDGINYDWFQQDLCFFPL